MFYQIATKFPPPKKKQNDLQAYFILLRMLLPTSVKGKGTQVTIFNKNKHLCINNALRICFYVSIDSLIKFDV